MASRAFDSFNRPDSSGLGTADSGQPWSAHFGSGSIKNGKAYFIGNSMQTVDVGAGGGDSEVGISIVGNDGGGQALYFRVVDSNRWWRLYKRQYTYSYTYQSGTSEPTYGWVGNGTYYYEPAGGWVYTGSYPMSPSDPNFSAYRTDYSNYDSRVGVYLYRVDYSGGYVLNYVSRNVYENQTYQQISGGEPIYSTGYATATEMVLEKSVNGVVSRVRSVAISSGIDNFSVYLDGDLINCQYSGGQLWSPIQDPTHKDARRHGVGFSSGSEVGNNHGIDSFYAQPFVTSGYVPYVML